MNTLFILVGLPFSGKSTLLKYISEYTNIIPLSFDILWKEREKNPEEKEKLSFEYLTKVIDKKIGKLLDEGHSVIYDSLNDTVDQRERLLNLAKVNNSSCRIIYLDTPFEIIKQRRLENTKTMERHLVDDENFNKSIKKFIIPSENENPMKFRYDEDIVLWIKENLKEYLK